MLPSTEGVKGTNEATGVTIVSVGLVIHTGRLHARLREAVIDASHSAAPLHNTQRCIQQVFPLVTYLLFLPVPAPFTLLLVLFNFIKLPELPLWRGISFFYVKIEF